MKTISAKGRGSSGLTLLELVIAMAIIAFALFGLVSVIAFTTRSNLATKQRVLAMRAAERKIEQMAATGNFNDILIQYNNTTAGYGVDSVEGLNYNAVGGSAFNNQIVFVSFPIVPGTDTLNETLTGAFLDNRNAAGVATNIDLNMDGDAIDGGGDPSNPAVPIASAELLPVRVDVRWKGVMGNSELTYRYVFRRP